MLNPNGRSLYTAALTPPPGLVFDEALATTFSLDPAVLLTVPLHLALLGGNQHSTLRDGLAVLEAVRRLSDRITIYAQRGRLLVPGPTHVLYGLLESMVVEVTAPRRGVFHPKLWLMRFVDPTNPDAVLVRLLILSRNLTADRSWDVALTLEGRPTRRYRSENRALGELVRDLPKLAFGGEVDEARVGQAARLADELRRAEWELPPGFDSVAFHVLGLKRGGWLPSHSSRLAVISPFCTDDALQRLAATTRATEALVTRPETLADLTAPSRALFGRTLGLDEAAETEDGEDVEQGTAHDTHGLHAKVYVFECRKDTHVVLGSANATSAALIAGKNVEVLAELVGQFSRVGGVQKLLGAEGLGEVLAELPEPGEPPPDDAERRAAEKSLEAARDTLAQAPLRVRCACEGDDAWTLELQGTTPCFDGLAGVRAWPITVGDDRAVTVPTDGSDSGVCLGVFGPATVTGLIAFELRAAKRDLRVRFVLNLPVDGLPESRDAAVLRTVVRNRSGFLRYLLLLLGDLGFGPPPPDVEAGGGGSRWGMGEPGSLPLLEELVRAYIREPERLREVGHLVRRLCTAPDGDDIVPADFLETWRVFEAAMERRDG